VGAEVTEVDVAVDMEVVMVVEVTEVEAEEEAEAEEEVVIEDMVMVDMEIGEVDILDQDMDQDMDIVQIGVGDLLGDIIGIYPYGMTIHIHIPIIIKLSIIINF
jgi:hypothetical protein